MTASSEGGRQPWIANAGVDLGFIIGPAFFVTIAVFLLSGQIAAIDGTPPWLWLLLVVGVDVSHVYSTLFRTYLDRTEMKKRAALYTLAPLAAWLAGVVLYSIGSLWFWRVLAYLAVIHFVRQQYGFMMIYARGERALPAWARRIDQIAIYAATILPLLFWHLHHRNFSWFMTGDFVQFDAPQFGTALGAVSAIIVLAYLAKEIFFSCRVWQFNLPKNLLLLGTALSWSVGIVIFDSDIAFTATNVIAHGIPYTALIWLYGHNQRRMEKSHFFSASWAGVFQWKWLPLYIALLFGFAFVEEGLWDGLIWREHGGIFGAFGALPRISSADMMAWLVPLLTLPQAVHYILDAVIWKHDLKDSEWKTILFYQRQRKA